MSDTKEKAKIYTSPAGLANYCWLNRPDTTFNAEGTYQTNLIIKKTAAAKITKVIKAEYDKAQKKFAKKNKKKRKADLPYFFNDDGDIEIKFSQKAVIHSKATGESYKKTVAVFDSKRRPCKANIGRGTEMKVAFEIIPYYHPTNGVGVTLRLKGVQVINLVEYDGSQSAEDMGFDEEDGFSSDDEDMADDNDDTPEEEEDDDNDDQDDPEEDSGEEDDEDIPF